MLVWGEMVRCGGPQASLSVKATQCGGGGREKEPGLWNRLRGPVPAVVVLGKACGLNPEGPAYPEPSSLKGQERGTPPHSTSSARAVCTAWRLCSFTQRRAELREAPLLVDIGQETQVSSTPRPGGRPGTRPRAPTHTACRLER